MGRIRANLGCESFEVLTRTEKQRFSRRVLNDTADGRCDCAPNLFHPRPIIIGLFLAGVRTAACSTKMVGTARFELATSRTPSVRATRLRYVPTSNLTTTRQIREGRIAVASALTRLSPPFEKRRESVQRVAQIEQHSPAEQLRSAVSGMIRASACEIVRAGFFAQAAARAGNGKSFVVKQPLD